MTNAFLKVAVTVDKCLLRNFCAIYIRSNPKILSNFFLLLRGKLEIGLNFLNLLFSPFTFSDGQSKKHEAYAGRIHVTELHKI